VEGLDQERPVSALEVDVAQGAECHPAAGIEAVQHSLPPAVGSQLLLEGPEDLRFDRFELEADLVADAAATLDAIVPLAFQLVGEQPSPLRQRMLGRGGHLRQRQARVPPRHHVARAGNVDLGQVIPSPDRLGMINLEELRM
jgi:hypothetical protein